MNRRRYRYNPQPKIASPTSDGLKLMGCFLALVAMVALGAWVMS